MGSISSHKRQVKIQGKQKTVITLSYVNFVPYVKGSMPVPYVGFQKTCSTR